MTRFGERLTEAGRKLMRDIQTAAARPASFEDEVEWLTTPVLGGIAEPQLTLEDRFAANAALAEGFTGDPARCAAFLDAAAKAALSAKAYPSALRVLERAHAVAPAGHRRKGIVVLRRALHPKA